MNEPDNDSPISRRQVTVVICTEYDAQERPIAITELREGVETISENQRDPRTVRVEYERFQTEECTYIYHYDADGNRNTPET